MTIKQKILILIILFIILPTLAIPFITTSAYEKILESKINTSSQQNLTQIANSLEMVTNNMSAASVILATDKELQEVLKKPASEDPWQEVTHINLVQGKMDQLLNTMLLPYSSSILIADFNGRVYNSRGITASPKFEDIQSQEWYEDTWDIGGSMLWLAPARDYFTFIPEGDNNSIALSLLIQNDIEGFCGIVVIVLDIQRKNWSLFDQSAQGGNAGFYITNSEGGVIYPSGRLAENDLLMKEIDFTRFSDISGSETVTVNGKKLVVNSRGIRKTGWQVHQVILYDELTKQMKDVRSWVILFQILLTAALIFAAAGISMNIANPMHRLALLMGEVPKGNFNVRMKVKEKGNSEINKLGNSFNEMVKEMENLFNELHQAYQLREKAQLEALQAQINPHFLLNTLNSIRWMATLSGATNVSDMITALADLLDATLYRKDEMVALSEEIQCLKNYIILQKMRYGDKFEMQDEIPEELLNYQVPILILQPLVENSVLHAFHNQDGGGIIVLKGHVSDEEVIIQVLDNGQGIREEVLENLLAEPGEKKKKFNRIGVKNVHERIRLIYGKEYGLKINSSGEGTRIEILLPPAGEKGKNDAQTVNR